LHATKEQLPRHQRRQNARSIDKARAHRERMRARGFRPVQLWVPDTRTADFRAEAHRQSRAVARSASEREDQAFIDAISDRRAE